MVVSSLFKKKQGKEAKIFSILLKLANVLYIFPVKKGFSTEKTGGFWIMVRLSGFFFLKLKQAKPFNKHWLIKEQKISFKQKKIKRCAIIGLQCFSTQSWALDTSVLDQCFLQMFHTYLVCITVLFKAASTNPYLLSN